MYKISDEDIRLLEAFYHDHIRVPGMRTFEELTEAEKLGLKNTLIFARYRLGTAVEGLKASIKAEFNRFFNGGFSQRKTTNGFKNNDLP